MRTDRKTQPALYESVLCTQCKEGIIIRDIYLGRKRLYGSSGRPTDKVQEVNEEATEWSYKIMQEE
jgi:hypothetical protein